jgi:hypothetical protein
MTTPVVVGLSVDAALARYEAATRSLVSALAGVGDAEARSALEARGWYADPQAALEADALLYAAHQLRSAREAF